VLVLNDSPAPQKQTRSNVSAGLLMFRRRIDIVEFLLRPSWRSVLEKQRRRAWTIPKEKSSRRRFLNRARPNFEEN